MESYPERLLPRPNFHLIEDSSLSQRDLVLVRHADATSTERETCGILSPNEIRIQSDHLRDLSCNLLGIFRKEDIYYQIVKEKRNVYCALWEKPNKGLKPTTDEFIKDTSKRAYFIPIDQLLTYPLPEIKEHHYHFMVFHTPTVCNFWHVSIRLLNEEGQEVSTLAMSEKERHKVWKSAKDFLVGGIIQVDCKEGSYTTIAPEHFMDK